MKIFISMSAMSECINPDSFGEICVCYNACGRFDKNTQKECALNLYKKLLKEEYEFNGWIEGMEDGLVQAGTITNDSRRYIQSITHRFGVDRENPRVEVKITEVAE